MTKTLCTRPFIGVVLRPKPKGLFGSGEGGGEVIFLKICV